MIKNLKYSGLLVVIVFLVNAKATNDQNDDTSNNFDCEPKSTSRFSSVIQVGILSSLVFSFIGILPAFFIRNGDEEIFKNSLIFKFLLSFAAGSLLGDVFLHLIPEAFNGNDNEQIRTGLYSLMAFLLFLIIEKITGLIPNAHALGMLNLIANFFDNTAHGTTVVGAFEVSQTFGMISLIATIIHEVPHEFSDFALLLRDGYSRNKAIFFQILTASAGTIGATVSYILTTSSTISNQCSVVNNFENSIFNLDNQHNNSHGSFVMPFTIGGFLYISLVGIMPEIVEETDRKISLLQLISVIFGITFIYFLVQIEHIIPGYLL